MTRQFSTIRRTGRNPFSVAVHLDESLPAKGRDRSVAERAAARETKRRNEWIKSATQRAEQLKAAERRRVADANRRIAEHNALLTGKTARVSKPRVITVEQSCSVRNPPRPLQNCQRLRVWEIAAAIGMTSARTVALLREHGEYVRNAHSTVVAPAATAFITAHKIGA